MNATDAAQHNAPTVGKDDKPGSPQPPTDALPNNNDININQTDFLPNGDVHTEHAKSVIIDACTMSTSPHSSDSIVAAQLPSGTPPQTLDEHSEDVKMAETPEGVVEDMLVPSAASPDVPVTDNSPNGKTTSNGSTYSPYRPADADDDDHAKPPPAKRARKHSGADQASLANTASPPPATGSSVQMNDESASSPAAVLPTPTQPGDATLSIQQHRFCLSTIRSLKKLKDGAAFLHPVDPIALNIPHYPSIIKSPMDLGTIERKLMSSNPQKPDPNPHNPHYNNADEFVADVRLVFANCITFNGPDHIVSQAGKRVESVFDKQIKNLPPPQAPKPPIKVATPPPPPPAPAKKAPVPSVPARRPSTSVPVIRRNDSEQVSARPKREIHPPPPKDLPYADAPKKLRKPKVAKDDGTAEQLKFCAKLLVELHRKQHWAIANPFYEPVDPLKLEIPTYFKIIKKPMDLSTMRRKLENREYPSASKFFDDFKLMIRNCFTFNPVGTPVNQAGIELQRLFDEKWKNVPPLREVSEEEEELEEEDNESEEERNRKIATMEAQIETMRGSLMALKSQPPKEKKKKKESNQPAAASSSKGTVARNSKKLAHAASGAGNGTVKRKSKKQALEDDALSFEQKKDLSEAIGKLDGQKLEKVIQIIHEGVPEIRDSTEEIEIEIDLLPANVLSKLYNFVLRPLRQPAQKRTRPTGRGTGTGGLKRKSMDENAEAEKIRQLEERMKLFENPSGTTGAAPPSVPVHRHDESDSDSSSDESSASESE